MPQTDAWEREYRQPQLVTKDAGPQSDVKDFLKFLRRKEHVELSGLKVIDIGSGTGRNTNYLAELGNEAYGMDISKTAIKIAKERATALKLPIPPTYHIQSIGDPYPFEDNSFDLALDVTSSNSLNERERASYLSETRRVLKPEGHFFVRALCKDGDQNAKNLIKLSPGPEHDTYINNDMQLTERVFTEADFRTAYEPYFAILELSKKTTYARFKGQSYKRNYWLAYLKKPLQ
jgi:SAM-dependent methyltransferase